MRFRLLLIFGPLLIGALLLGACRGSDEETTTSTAGSTDTTQADAPTPAPEPTAVPEPTDVAEPTAAPEPTAVPEPTAAPEPTAEPESGELACAADAAPGQTSAAIDSDGNTYDYTLQIPKGYNGAAVPLVFNFHGLGSEANEQAPFSGYPALADAEGFAVVHPTGQPDTEGRNSWELSWFDDPTRDDVQFVRELVDAVSSAVCIDAARIYSTGMSNGGFFSSEVVCQLGDVFAASASVAGVSHSPDCDPIRPMPYIAFHGTADETVPFDGGGESSLGTSEFFEQVMPDEFAEFAADFNCAAEPVATSLSEAVTRFDYVDCADDVELSFYELVGHGHNWPGSFVGKAIEAMLGPNNMDVDASALSWEFFERHTLPDEFQ